MAKEPWQKVVCAPSLPAVSEAERQRWARVLKLQTCSMDSMDWAYLHGTLTRAEQVALIEDDMRDVFPKGFSNRHLLLAAR